CMQALEFPWTL
nr:immunoglobulin light chain junction region [Macaca mulatta]MOY00371.1 immunoglobulin light chain junction region [Macaca mulatta]MOY03374.1 immunoglobulin light chain junction region [Macaca mulatta]MOY10688.1 immunoglobulin light chain junction region [Macaca mulatta]MOY14386.1 immunoglobulin light chain junction region [Macaca mulatta]